MILGITGVFGSGKTTIARMFSRYGYRHINADEIGHRLLNDKKIKNRIIKEFGSSILTKSRIDRRKLKDVVFYDHKKLAGLNRIIHPAIIEQIKSQIKKSKNKKIIVEGALLIEAGCTGLIDKLIVAKTKRKEQMARALKKKKYTREEIENIIRSQLSQKEKLKYADIVIDNSKNIVETEKQAKKIMRLLK
jgi:dephospho-CoA kinase